MGASRSVLYRIIRNDYLGVAIGTVGVLIGALAYLLGEVVPVHTAVSTVVCAFVLFYSLHSILT